ncbi:MAG: hypothetical protein U5L11_07365 [Arhodomonas sp.]|nr:hypothetical protein [Arhodomonas sp.]
MEEVAADVYAGKLAGIYGPAAEQAVDKALADGAQFATWSEEEKARARDIVQPEQVDMWKREVAEPRASTGRPCRRWWRRPSPSMTAAVICAPHMRSTRTGADLRYGGAVLRPAGHYRRTDRVTP